METSVCLMNWQLLVTLALQHLGVFRLLCSLSVNGPAQRHYSGGHKLASDLYFAINTALEYAYETSKMEIKGNQ